MERKTPVLIGKDIDWRLLGVTGLVISFQFMLPSKTSFNLPVLAMALFAIALTWRHGTQFLTRKAWQWLVVLFACLWFPMIVAALDAVDGSRTLIVTSLYPRFLLAGLFVLWVLQNERARRWVTLAAFYLVALWTVDALVQYVVGWNILGYRYDSGQLRGVFGPKYRLGLSLAMFLPLILDVALRQRLVHRAWSLLVPAMLVVIALTLHRNSWVMSAVALLLYSAFLLFYVGWRPRLRGVLAGVFAGVILVGVASTQSTVVSRFSPAFNALMDSPEVLEAQLGQRPDIWRTAIRMFEGNLMNGVGPRGFRTAYEEHAVHDDYWMNLDPPQTPAHPHQIFLEIAAETGVVGIAGYIALWLVLGLAFARARRPSALRAAPWLLGFVITVFPTNISKAFYSSATASLAWWMLLVGLAFLTTSDAADDTRSDDGATA